MGKWIDFMDFEVINHAKQENQIENFFSLHHHDKYGIYMQICMQK